jgi:hypothetical protein
MPSQQTVSGPPVAQSSSPPHVTHGSSSSITQIPSPQWPMRHKSTTAHSASSVQAFGQHSPRQHSKPGWQSAIASTQYPSTHVLSRQGSSFFLLRQSRCVRHGVRQAPATHVWPSRQPSAQASCPRAPLRRDAKAATAAISPTRIEDRRLPGLANNRARLSYCRCSMSRLCSLQAAAGVVTRQPKMGSSKPCLAALTHSCTFTFRATLSRRTASCQD